MNPGSSKNQQLAGIEHLSPGYFALVMATGIVSMALHDQGHALAAKSLFTFNLVAYLVLWSLFLLRFVKFRRSMIQDFQSHDRSAGFLTLVAATSVLGIQFVSMSSWMSVAAVLWLAAGILWIFLNYTFFGMMMLHDPKPSLEKGIRGSWLLAVVAIESIAILGVPIAGEFPQKHLILFICLASVLAGVLIYLCLITLIFYRWMFFPIKPEKLTPDYWINMGALAITTVAGTSLLSANDEWELLRNLAPLLAGLTIAAWAVGIWWIPLLLIAGEWKVGQKHVPWRYDPNYWAMVFPLGMFSVATDQLVKVLKLDFLAPLGRGFAYIAALAWGLVLIGFILSFVRRKGEAQ